jgi:purine-nucleoside phosphorylase
VAESPPDSRPSSAPVAIVRAAAERVRERTGRAPELGLILGSGLDRVVDALADPVVLPYSEIPGSPVSTVPGHPGQLVLGRIAGREVAALVGRVHYYEGYDAAEVTFLVRLLAALGCQTLIVTNAAGSLNPEYRPGELMLIADHINLPGLAGQSPLRGPEGAAFGPRFVDMSDAYDPDLRRLALLVAADLRISPRQGVYAMVAGPSYETPAESRLLRAAGADAVGMSTALEVVAARQLGLRVLGVSLITNVAGGGGGKLSHEEVVAASLAAGPQLARLIVGVVERLA